MKRHLELEDVQVVDYILISHAHFDHLPGADRLALKTGATVIANCEAINLLRRAGVPESQLLPVAGGERVPIFTRTIREQAAAGTCDVIHGPPGSPARPHPKLASFAIHVWPSLHCLMPGSDMKEIPPVFDTGKVYSGSATEFDCTVDITNNMTWGLLRLHEIVPEDKMDDKLRAVADFMRDRQRNVMSGCDGGQLMFNVVIGDRVLLFNSHLGAYEGIMRMVDPRPQVVVMGIAGRANHNGRPFEGSAAQFAVKELQWLQEPKKVIWCLHDESLLPPFKVDTAPAAQLVKQETKVEVVDLPYAEPYILF
ncbi:beta-lactamase domain protein [Colletotrichum tofieldiae]|nr:beta-lactamase domain protein [Colletotrichum tofieldiae]